MCVFLFAKYHKFSFNNINYTYTVRKSCNSEDVSVLTLYGVGRVVYYGLPQKGNNCTLLSERSLPFYSMPCKIFSKFISCFMLDKPKL